MKVIFMGTPDFSVGALHALVEAGHDIVLVVTQPDKKKGRGGAVSMSPVKEYALAHGLQVFQPVKVREEEAVRTLQEAGADVFIVAAFGQILPQSVLDIPPHGCINIHASLLPRLRGAAPIQQAILDGEAETGITIMQMDAGCDTGDILLQEAVPIGSEDTGGSLFDALSALGARMIVEALKKLQAGELVRTVQDDKLATMTGKIEKSSGRIDWTRDASYIERAIRAFTPWPGSFTSLNGKTLKVFKARVLSADENAGVQGAESGVITSVSRDDFTVQTGSGMLLISEVQMEGKKRMSVHDFLLGHALSAGTVLG